MLGLLVQMKDPHLTSSLPWKEGAWGGSNLGLPVLGMAVLELTKIYQVITPKWLQSPFAINLCLIVVPLLLGVLSSKIGILILWSAFFCCFFPREPSFESLRLTLIWSLVQFLFLGPVAEPCSPDPPGSSGFRRLQWRDGENTSYLKNNAECPGQGLQIKSDVEGTMVASSIHLFAQG